MLKVRLQRTGRRNRPSYRMVVVDHTKGPKSNNVVEIVGFHDPLNKQTKIDADRVKYWISVGAQTSDTVHNMLVNNKVIEGKKVNVLGKKTPIVSEKAEEEAAPAQAPAASEEGGEATEAPAEEKKEEEPKEEEKPAEESAPEAEEPKEEETKETA